ncbi:MULTISPECIES: hypothetical protein [unclassified Paenibacillus]|uniref:hypothetical protein n=1 Tax=unclassified Paenibacillus TaxID=185978 RepID=UPI00277F0EC2|nr:MULTISPECIES: hypothetical protein [unclassified Paenibacillus]MDQ0896231.1 hypothetical protein [Paenibacillus sp. V4I7]MDQ0913954.1 hypothetical protein [Paenibacillus sp. V4I5]
MIKWAVFATIQQWGAMPPDGFITYVSDAHVESQNKGCCYKKSGFIEIGRSKSRNLLLLQLTESNARLVFKEMSLLQELQEIKNWMQVAIYNGEWIEADSFHEKGLLIAEQLHELKKQMRKQKMAGWTKFESPLSKYEFLLELSPDGFVPEDSLNI